MSPLLLFAGILATWRVTHLITAEDGPFNLVARLRQGVGDGFFGDLMDCFYCCSLWVAAPLAYWVGASGVARGVAWLALSGGAILVERLIPERPHRATGPPSASAPVPAAAPETDGADGAEEVASTNT